MKAKFSKLNGRRSYVILPEEEIEFSGRYPYEEGLVVATKGKAYNMLRTLYREEMLLRKDIKEHVYFNSVIPDNIVPTGGSMITNFPNIVTPTSRSGVFTNSSVSEVLSPLGNSQFSPEEEWSFWSHGSQLYPSEPQALCRELLVRSGSATDLVRYEYYKQDGSVPYSDSTYDFIRNGPGFIAPRISTPPGDSSYTDSLQIEHSDDYASPLFTWAMWIRVITGSVGISVSSKNGNDMDNMTSIEIHPSDGWTHVAGRVVSKQGLLEKLRVRSVGGSSYHVALPFVSTSDIVLRPWQHPRPIFNR